LRCQLLHLTIVFAEIAAAPVCHLRCCSLPTPSVVLFVIKGR